MALNVVCDLPLILDNLLKAVDHAGVVILTGYRDVGLDLSVTHIKSEPIFILGSCVSYTRVLTTSSGYMTRISLTPATAPAANW